MEPLAPSAGMFIPSERWKAAEATAPAMPAVTYMAMNSAADRTGDLASTLYVRMMCGAKDHRPSMLHAKCTNDLCEKLQAHAPKKKQAGERSSSRLEKLVPAKRVDMRYPQVRFQDPCGSCGGDSSEEAQQAALLTPRHS